MYVGHYALIYINMLPCEFIVLKRGRGAGGYVCVCGRGREITEQN